MNNNDYISLTPITTFSFGTTGFSLMHDFTSRMHISTSQHQQPHTHIVTVPLGWVVWG